MTDYDLELVNLRKVYPGGTVAVENFDLQVSKGEFISFVRAFGLRQDNDASDDCGARRHYGRQPADPGQ